MIRNLVNMAIWFCLFSAVALAWTASIPAALVAGAVGVLILAALSVRVTVDRS